MFIMAEKESIDPRLLRELVLRINDDSKRIRLVEQKLEKVEIRFDHMEDMALVQLKNLEANLERLGNKFSLINERIKSLEDRMDRIEKEMAKTAKKTDIKQLESFIDLINPVTSRFVTKDEMENYIEEKLAKKV